MQIAPEIVFQGMARSAPVEERILAEIEKLERFFGRIISARVVMDGGHRRHHKGNVYAVRIHLALPGGHDISVDREPGLDHAHEDPKIAVRDAFKAARRQLQDRVRKMRGEVKLHEAPPRGKILQLFAEQGYGFIKADDGREVYFHRNSVADDGFDELEVDDGVEFHAEAGDKGPQATIVKPTGSPSRHDA